MINRLTRLTRYIPFVVQIPVMGTDSSVRFAIETVSITAGYLLLIGTFFTILRQLQVSEHKSARRAGELAAEIEERKRISAALHRHEERYRLLFEGNNDGILLIGMNHEIEVFNAQMEKMLGYSLEEISDLKPAAIVHSDYQAIFSTTLESFLTNQPVRRTVEIPLCCKDGSQLETEASFDLIKSDKEPIGVQVIFRDISDRKELEEERKATEEQIQHARRLESLITMAGGIAHDFNNLLQAIIGHVEMIRMSLTEASPIKEDVERIHQAAWQAAVLTNRMLSYSGRGGFYNQALDLNEVIRKNET
ncbi:MAG: PAS domain S-box protein, partial [Candidatus Omnitrophica bacterium]|nr:PAS domain S-box protein [Candidatus Omnitrophota bacterium]